MQMPYIPPFSILAKPVFKAFDYQNNNQLLKLARQVVMVPTLQSIF